MSIDGIPIETLPASPSRALSSETDAKRLKPPKPNLLKILRDAVGKDLTRMTIPVYFNEPLSFLQRVTEDMEHSTLLDSAADEALAGTGKRAALVAAFVVSHYAATAGRTGKPFNPLLGETFDVVIPERRLAVVAEQVSHHPPVAALHAAGAGWVYYTAYRVRSRFHGNSLEVWPEGVVHVRFSDGDHFCYEQAHTFVSNLVVGSLWIDNAGTVDIQDITHGKFQTSLKLKRCTSMFSDSKSFGAVTGEVRLVKRGTVCHKISGNWRKEVSIDGEVVWTAPPSVNRHRTAGHTMTEWAWGLNCELNETDRRLVPRTDSRLRPDERALEQGDYSTARSEKDRLERSQRERRKDVEIESVDAEIAADTDNNARWFDLREEGSSKRQEWQYRGGYFETKLAAADGGDWPNDVPNIF